MAGLMHEESKVLLDPYATSVVSRARWGEKGNQALDYESDQVLGFADTWPQAAASVPDPKAKGFDWQVGNRNRGV
jgi:pullulanase/glycogen debranching enzyme